MRPYNWVGLLSASLLIAGCADKPAPQQDNRSDGVTASEAEPVAVQNEGTLEKLSSPPKPGSNAGPEIPLNIRSWDAVQAWVAEQRGRVVVIDLWSTSCPPCLQEFPHFVKLHEKHRERVACASLSVDFYGGEGNKAEDVRPQVLKFLTSLKATMQNFISSDTDGRILEHIGASSIPVVLVYDRQGKLNKIFKNDEEEFGSGGFNYQDDIVPLVKQLLQSGT
jgi:thiol-disulfide isomerase/thioredoxin